MGGSEKTGGERNQNILSGLLPFWVLCLGLWLRISTTGTFRASGDVSFLLLTESFFEDSFNFGHTSINNIPFFKLFLIVIYLGFCLS